MSPYMRRTLVILLVVLISYANAGEQRKLTDYILDYQPLTYDSLDLHAKHDRVRRSVDPHLQLKFDAYGRSFQLKLKRDNSVFAPDHMMKESDGSLSTVDTSFLYSGHLEDIPDSYAHIAVLNGTARGYVHVPGHTTYHIEPASMYFQNPVFHTVIYPETHMDLDPYRHRRSAEVDVYGNDFAAEWMKQQAESVIDDAESRRAKRYSDWKESPHSKYTADSNSDDDRRERRSTIGERNTCNLYLRADPNLWEYVKERKFNMQLTDARTQEEILAFFASHVSAVNNIYSKKEFRTYDGSMRFTGVDFVVQRTGIMTPENQHCGTSQATSYCNPSVDVYNFLNLNSLDNHDEYCLAYVFTFQSFSWGTMGLTWIASSDLREGGVCARHLWYQERESRVSKSFNTGIVTVIFFGKVVPARVSQLTFAHEIGHNLGSPHDSGPTCAPYGTNRTDAEKGNYIMFGGATMGDKPNNYDLSICSLDNITRVLDAVINQRHGKFNCFRRAQWLGGSTEAFCGNRITEPGEDCDCGYQFECKDMCCYGKGSTDGDQCSLRAGKSCSPTAGPCCLASCGYIRSDEHVVCAPKDECKAESLCAGNSAQCPPAVQRPNGTFCNDYSQICVSGECASSVCHRIQWEECFLTSDNHFLLPKAMCYVSCRNPVSKKCIISNSMTDIDREENLEFKDLLREINRLLKTDHPDRTQGEGLGIQRPGGYPCNNFRGYCDPFYRCSSI